MTVRAQDRPVVSVIMANRNGGAYLADAIASVLKQDLAALELLLCDDGSTDDSLAIAAGFAAGDHRLRILTQPQPTGPAAARNRAIAEATGRWIAIVDSDDIIHPGRLSRLVAAAARDDADIVADDMLAFDQDAGGSTRALFARALRGRARWIDATTFVAANHLFGSGMPLGYLKPLIRTDLLRTHGIRYDEALRIAEDYDLLLRLLVRGARFRLVPELTYFYRRHAASISHRLTAPALTAMQESDAALRRWARGDLTPTLTRALDRRLLSVERAAALGEIAARAKAGQLLGALHLALRKPTAAMNLLRFGLRGRIARLRRRTAVTQGDHRPSVSVLSRQRVQESTNGSSTYLLGICGALRAEGFSVHLICPTPGVLGRTPVMSVARESRLLDSISIRGTWRVGDLVIARAPRIWFAAALGVADRLARRIGITALAAHARPAPYAVALPWTTEDYVYVARHARGRADAVLADYGFLSPGIPYALRPRSPSAILMHDLFSSRPAGFASIGSTDSVVRIDAGEEAALLAAADTVIAIQSDEAAKARAMLPAGRRVVVAPMAATPVAAPQPSDAAEGLLFVGSGTAPNVDALRWFLAEVMPRLQHAGAPVRLRVAGTVCARFVAEQLPASVDLLGRVDDLASLYRSAAVVISPLRVGSGLKIKLIEALAQGKAVVATGVTLQGVSDLVMGAVRQADDAAAFAGEIQVLLADDAARARLASAALAVATRHLRSEVAYAQAIAVLRPNAHAALARVA